VILVTIMVGIIFWFLECPQQFGCEDFAFGGMDGTGWGRTMKGFSRTVARTMHLAFGALSTGFNHTPVTSFGRVFSIVHTLFILVLVTAYTANLAAYLVAADPFTPVSTVDEMKLRSGTLCVQSGAAYSRYLDDTYTKGAANEGNPLKLCSVTGSGKPVPTDTDTGAKCTQLTHAEDYFEYGVLKASAGDDWTTAEIKGLADANSLTPTLQEMAMRVIDGSCLALADVHTQSEYVAALSDNDARPFCLLKNSNNEIDTACEATTTFCEALVAADDKFWEQNLGVGIHKSLSGVAEGIGSGLIPLRGNSHFDELNEQYFPEATCNVHSDTERLDVIHFAALFIILIVIGILLVLFELFLKYPTRYINNKVFGHRIIKMFHRRDAKELATDLQAVFESYSGGDPRPWYEFGGAIGANLSLSFGALFVLIGFIIGVRSSSGFQFGGGVLGGFLGALLGAILGNTIGVACNVYMAIRDRKKEDVGHILQRSCEKHYEGQIVEVRLTRKELIRFALHEMAYLSREQVFGPVNGDEMKIVWGDEFDDCSVEFGGKMKGKMVDLASTPKKKSSIRKLILPDEFQEPDSDDGDDNDDDGDDGPMTIPVDKCIQAMAEYPAYPPTWDTENPVQRKLTELKQSEVAEGHRDIRVESFIAWWAEQRNDFLSKRDPRTCVIGLLTAQLSEAPADDGTNGTRVSVTENESGCVSWNEFSTWYRAHHLDAKRGYTLFDYLEEGEIEAKNFREFLALVGGLTKDEVNQAIEEMDADHGGTVSYDEFLGWFLHTMPVVQLEKELAQMNIKTEQGVRDLFKKYDTDGSGELDIAELSKAVASLHGRDTKVTDVRAALKAMDTDGNGTIDEEEFVQWWKSTEEGKVLRSSASSVRMKPRKRSSVHALRASLGFVPHVLEANQQTSSAVVEKDVEMGGMGSHKSSTSAAEASIV
jgi:calmodulin